MKKNLAWLLAIAQLLTCSLCGCTAGGTETTSPPEATEPTGTTQAPTEPPTAEKTEAALAQIAALGTPTDDNYRTWYEIFVYAYCDSNGDGIGDINGMRSRLPQLAQLGITGIWLMPVHPSSSYHKYNVEDYYAIDPAYGTMEDFEAFLSECDALGIRVIMDLVVNHSGSDHPWFRSACAYLGSLPQDQEPNAADCPYIEYYNFGTEPTAGWSNIRGSNRFYYECQFSSTMPDLNWDCQAMRDEIKAIMEFWLGKGVAGFRLDAAKEFYSGNPTKNIEVLRWLQDTAVSIREDAYLVAEVWDSATTITDYYASGITSIFSYAYGDATGRIVTTLRGAGRENIVSLFANSMASQDAANRANNPDYIDAPFLSNHDVGRIYGFVARDEAKTKLAAAMNLFMSGSAFIYYGEEIGMIGSGNDPSKRAPMYWNPERNDGTCSPAPDCTIPEKYPLGSLAEQLNDDDSVYNYYRQAIAIRNALPVISHGVVTAETELNIGCVSAIRKTWNDECCIILLNIDPEAAQVDLSGYSDWNLAATLSAEGTPTELDGATLNMAPYGVAILLPAQ